MAKSKSDSCAVPRSSRFPRVQASPLVSIEAPLYHFLSPRVDAGSVCRRDGPGQDAIDGFAHRSPPASHVQIAWLELHQSRVVAHDLDSKARLL